MTTIDDNITWESASETEITRKTLEEKDRQIQALKLRVEVLEDLLSRLSAPRTAQLQARDARTQAPRRWSVR